MSHKVRSILAVIALLGVSCSAFAQLSSGDWSWLEEAANKNEVEFTWSYQVEKLVQTPILASGGNVPYYVPPFFVNVTEHFSGWCDVKDMNVKNHKVFVSKHCFADLKRKLSQKLAGKEKVSQVALSSVILQRGGAFVQDLTKCEQTEAGRLIVYTCK